MNEPKKSYTIGLNQFTDMHEDEMKAFHCRVTTMDNQPLVPSNKWIKKRVDDISLMASIVYVAFYELVGSFCKYQMRKLYQGTCGKRSETVLY